MASALGGAAEEDEENLVGVVQQGSFSRALCTSSGPFVSPSMTTATVRKDDTQTTSRMVRTVSHGVSSFAYY